MNGAFEKSGGARACLVIGPTASGKTALAIALARGLPGGGEILSADSMQIYRGMDIGTAKPDDVERAAAPHHLIDVADPFEGAAPFTVHDWLRGANGLVSELAQREKIPIVAGGTSLYARAFLEGLVDVPPPDPAVRALLEARETADIRRELERVDPTAAERIHANDRRRTVRALEVHATTGTPLSAQQTQWDPALVTPQRPVVVVALVWDTHELNRRINARVKQMMAAGFLDEVERLTTIGCLHQQAREALGYRELAQHLKGELPLDDAIESIKIRSRQYAKKQRTWLRRFLAIPKVIRVNGPEALKNATIDAILAAQAR